ncbi:immunity 49 family protein [cf. Phormidesmis sp. LEGE 11477]|uniref:immunity 49 family protein n=1 Tax=cf. Phormidesmis sp. LEGE 11477 TaxID=1828680 RepID=UPI00187E7CEB|nr:immunity 49 family protein [cf. Phormidesmis sp. LEGE 11477]MBE9064237.1 immunity 49 family protein [cf. Phormidesmis sp. LEGE 11477]
MNRAQLNIPNRFKTADEQIWQDQIKHNHRLRQAVRDRTPTSQDGTDILNCEFRRAAIASLTNTQPELYAAITLATGGAQLAMLTQYHWRRYEDDHQIALIEPNTPERRCPVGSARLDWPAWIKALCAGLITRNSEAIGMLCTPKSVEICALAPNTIDAFWPFLCSTLAATVVEPAAASAVITDTLTGLDQATIAERSLVDLKLRPLISLIEALLSKRSDTFNAALHKALSAHRQYHEQSEPYDWQNLLALEITALAALAVDRGLELTVESDYMPPALVTDSFPRTPSQVIDYFPQRGILSANEAHWFMDLQGFPRESRSHTLLDSDGQLIAQYKAHGAPTIPHAVLPFALLDSATATCPLALDAGQLVSLAETFASKVPANSSPTQQAQAKALLNEAINCVDAAIARIPPGQDAVAPESITSQQGIQLYQSEPGRFRRDRLVAYRSGLTTFLQSLDSNSTRANQSSPAIAKSTSSNQTATAISETSAQADAIAAIEIIRVQMMPLLEAIAKDSTGRVIEQLIPAEADYAKVFVSTAIEPARAGYDKLWKNPRPFKRPELNQTEISCYLAPAGMLQSENELSAAFPCGYRAIAPYLNPHRIWASWKYCASGQSAGLSFNGLVWLDDRWAWFPKPYRILKM